MAATILHRRCHTSRKTWSHEWWPGSSEEDAEWRLETRREQGIRRVLGILRLPLPLVTLPHLGNLEEKKMSREDLCISGITSPTRLDGLTVLTALDFRTWLPGLVRRALGMAFCKLHAVLCFAVSQWAVCLVYVGWDEMRNDLHLCDAMRCYVGDAPRSFAVMRRG